MRIGIMSAMPEKNSLLVKKLSSSKQYSYGQRTYIAGILSEHETTLTFSRWGKVAKAITATQLITEFNVEAIIFTGVAGSCAPNTYVGDIVIVKNPVQHDMDANPLFPRYEIPLTGVSIFQTTHQRTKKAFVSTNTFLKNSFPKMSLDDFKITLLKIYKGCIASGDKFFASGRDLAELNLRLRKPLCIAMGGAAVAQICHDYETPMRSFE